MVVWRPRTSFLLQDLQNILLFAIKTWNIFLTKKSQRKMCSHQFSRNCAGFMLQQVNHCMAKENYIYSSLVQGQTYICFSISAVTLNKHLYLKTLEYDTVKTILQQTVGHKLVWDLIHLNVTKKSQKRKKSERRWLFCHSTVTYWPE